MRKKRNNQKMQRKTLDDLRIDCECQNTKYCPLEKLVVNVGDRMAEQHKLVEVFKYKQSSRLGREMNWNEAYNAWVDMGYAERFADVYHPDKDYRQLKTELNL